MSDRATLPGTYDQDIAREPEDEGCPHGRAREGCEACDMEEAHYRHIEQQVRNLARKVAEAEAARVNALSILDELMGDAVYDIEFAESVSGLDARDALAAAGSELRNAQRVITARAALLDAGDATP